MTLQDAITQRDAMLQNLGISKAQYQGRSFEFPTGDARIKELAYLEDLITQLTNQQAGAKSSRCTYGSFRRG